VLVEALLGFSDLVFFSEALGAGAGALVLVLAD